MQNNWQYLKRNQLDLSKWDQCIRNAENGRVYALAEYLDHTTQNWDALVYGNYEIVMPLPWKKKLGIRYVYTPPFVQQLGLFGSNLNHDISARGFEMAASRFRWIDFNVNESFAHSAASSRFKTNYVIELDRDYESIRAGYTTQCNTNLQKAIRRGCRFEEMLPVSEVIRLYRSAYGSRHAANDTDYHRFEMLMNNPSRFKVYTHGVRDDETNELIFGALIIEFGNRLYYAMGAPTEKGRNARATYFFIDQLLQRFAGSKRIFDFEGSDLPNVAEFYQRFGPKKEQYLHMKINNLPSFMRMFKS
jgi:hypothetical protein